MNNPYFSLVRSVWRHGRGWRGALVLVYVSSAIAQVFAGFTPFAFGKVVNLLQNFSPDRYHAIVLWLLATIGLNFLFWLFHGPSRVLERRMALRIWQRMWIGLYENLTRLPLTWHQERHSGNTVSRINRACDSLYQFAAEQFIYIQIIIKFLVAVGFLSWLAPAVGATSLVCCAVIFGVVIAFDKHLIPLYDRQNEKWNEVYAMFYDYVTNMTTVLTLRLGAQTRDSLHKKASLVFPIYRRDVTLNEIKWFVMNMLLAALQAAVLILYVGFMLKRGNAPLLGTLVMVYKYQLDIQDVFYTFAGHYGELTRKNTNVNGLQPLLNDIAALPAPAPRDRQEKDWTRIEIAELAFHHAQKAADGTAPRAAIFTGLGFTLTRGEKIALIGTSGAGKSTLLNLLRGLYVPEHARLAIDGKEFTSLEPLQALTTLIPQDPEIFENTIHFNIAMGLPEEEARVEDAIRLSGFAPVLRDLPEGLETDIREKGLNLSVGQKQRLALARGLFAAENRSIILMDEPTSSIDLPTERQVLMDTLDFFKDTTVIVSLHRLHLLPRFDRVIMLDQGRILADGPANALLAAPGPVRTLWLDYLSHAPGEEG